MRKDLTILVMGLIMTLGLSACVSLVSGPVGNASVPQPRVSVDLDRYVGTWFELARYENSFERGCENTTATYTRRPDGLIGVTNRCMVDGRERIAEGRARVIEGSGNARLKVSFFGPFFFGDYWVLDRADDYSWAIVGEPSGRFLWLLSRTPEPTPATRQTIESRARALGYDLSLLRPVGHDQSLRGD